MTGMDRGLDMNLSTRPRPAPSPRPSLPMPSDPRSLSPRRYWALLIFIVADRPVPMEVLSACLRKDDATSPLKAPYPCPLRISRAWLPVLDLMPESKPPEMDDGVLANSMRPSRELLWRSTRAFGSGIVRASWVLDASTSSITCCPFLVPQNLGPAFSMLLRRGGELLKTR